MRKIVTFGEIMLRLKSPEHERFFQSPKLEATFGGGEANVAVSLSLFGLPSSFVTVLPSNALGDAAEHEIRRYGVTTDCCFRTDGRLGIYFLETGSCQRPSLVVYDRENSCFARAVPGDFDWNAILYGAQWFHSTGITPAVSQTAADTLLAAIKAAKQNGVTISLDLNYRKKLWKYGKKAPEIMRELASYADVIVANEEDIQKCLDIASPNVDVSNGKLTAADYRVITAQVKKEFPSVSVVAITLRRSISADKNSWSAVLDGATGFYESCEYAINNIVDRVGSGDSFSAGLIYGLIMYPDAEQTALAYAAAASCLKHSISGDFNLTSREEVLDLMNGNGTGRIKR